MCIERFKFGGAAKSADWAQKNLMYKSLVKPILEYGLMHTVPSGKAIKELQIAQNSFLRAVTRCGPGTSIKRLHWLTENELSPERMKRVMVKWWTGASRVENSLLAENARLQVTLLQRRAAKIFTWLGTLSEEEKNELLKKSARLDAVKGLNNGLSAKKILWSIQGLNNANWLKLYLLGNLYLINQKRTDRTPFERLDLDKLCGMSIAQLSGWTLAGHGNEIGRSIHKVYSVAKKAD